MESFLKGWNLAWWTIRRDNNLLLPVIQRIEGVKEFLLSPFLSGHKLNIINQQNVNGTVFFTKGHSPVISDRIDQFVHELFRRDITKPKMTIDFFDTVSDGTHQMCFTKSYSSVNIKGIVCF